MRKVCVVSGTRAEYGLLKWVIKGISESSKLKLQIIATGMHLSSKFGLTYKTIEKDGYKINKKIDMLLDSDTDSGITKSIGIGMMGFADALSSLNPDILLILGDRFEIFSAATSAVIKRIPIAHLHGGEATQGLIDEPIRHSITKMSHMHFVSTLEYQNRVIQLGENPENVFLVGGLGVDAINKIKYKNRNELEGQLDFSFGEKNLLVTFHPVTLETETSGKQMKALLEALDNFKEINLIFTMPNADTGNTIIFELINDFVKRRKNAKSFKSLGQVNYLSCLKYVDGVIGNSSSGLLEVPSFKKGTINIGDRQKGRVKAKSVIDCSPTKESITQAIRRMYSDQFSKVIKLTINPYGNGGASDKIVETIENISLDDIIIKEFYDIK